MVSANKVPASSGSFTGAPPGGGVAKAGQARRGWRASFRPLVPQLAAVYGMPFGLHCATSEAAVIGMTRSLARELGRDWIRVNAVAPSAVRTEGTDGFFGARKDKFLGTVAAGQSLRRTLETGDLTGTVVYLASDASRLVAGRTIMVDGGTVFL